MFILKISVDAGDAGLLDALAAHHVWIVHLLELWECQRHGVRSLASVLAVCVYRLLTAALGVDGSSEVARHPAARAPLFRLLSLALRVCRHTRKYYGATQRAWQADALEGAAVTAALRAFASAPRFQAPDGNAHALRDECTDAITAFARDLHAAQASRSSSTPSKNTAGKGGAAGASGVGSAPADRTRLVLALCDHEADLQEVAASPLAPGAGGRLRVATLSVDELVATAWDVSPALAGALALRLSEAPAAARALYAVSTTLPRDTHALIA